MPLLQNRAWGKLSGDAADGTQKSLSLIDHSADVAAVLEALLALPTIRSRLERLAGCALGAASLCRLALFAFLHDVGKACVGFQSKRLAEAERSLLLRSATLRHAECGHVLTTAPLFCPTEIRPKATEALGVTAILRTENDLDFWFAAISHHGNPVRFQELGAGGWKDLRQNWRPVAGYDPIATLTELGQAARSWFPEAFGDVELPEAPALVHAFAGLTSLADWIASNPAPNFFPYEAGNADRMEFARPRARQVLRAMRIDVEDARKDLKQRHPGFGEVFRADDGTPFTPTPLQAAMEEPNLGQIVVAEDETGAGKTEAALWRFKILFEAGELDSLAFLLPTRVAAVSLEARVRRFITALFPDPGLRPNVLLAVPGYLRVDGKDGTLLAPFETKWPDEPDQQHDHRRWAAENAKRYLAAAIAVGTIDQALLAGLTTRHAHLRGAALMRSLLVVDEVHASDPYMTTLLQNLLHRHSEAGGHALLLSATLNAETRDGLLDPRQRRKVTSALGQPAELIPYPALSDRQSTREIPRRGQDKMVQPDLRPVIADPTAVAALAFSAAEAGARVLVIRNTVQDAIATQQALEEQAAANPALLFRAAGIVAPHHGRFAADDRRVLDAAVEQAIGRQAPRQHGMVLVGTQTLEQSLDIDADYLITDLAPIDILLQRIGRLHRHAARPRPAGFDTASAVILTPETRSLSGFLRPARGRRSQGLGSVYPSLLAIEATWRELETRSILTIPADNRVLVERGTDRTRLHSLAAELGDDWTIHAHAILGESIAQSGAATENALDWQKTWSEFGWADPGETIKTRLGLDDRLVELPEPWQSPFGSRLSFIKVPGWMVPKDAPDKADSVVEANAERLVFRWGAGEFAYDRYGLQRCSGNFGMV
jgi:CRISPR-associated endonuclease/helicase Cas3